MKVEQNFKERRATFEGVSYPENALPTPTLLYDGGYVLSRFDDGDAAVVWKVKDDYHCILSLPLAIPSDLLRHIALLAGVHLYNRKGDSIFAGGEYIGIRADEKGFRRICLPIADLTATDIITGEKVTVNDRFVDMWMEKGEIRILRFGKKY